MIARVWCAVAVVTLMAAPAAAQTPPPRWEVFGGYSLLSATPNDFPRGTSSGVEGGVALHVKPWWAFEFSAAAQFNTSGDLGYNFPGVVASSSVTELLGGPQFIVRTGRVDAFGHALVGIALGRTSLQGFSDSGFALGGGGGVDIRINHGLAVRVHAEYVGGFVDLMEGDLRLGAGLVVRLK